MTDNVPQVDTTTVWSSLPWTSTSLTCKAVTYFGYYLEVKTIGVGVYRGYINGMFCRVTTNNSDIAMLRVVSKVDQWNLLAPDQKTKSDPGMMR